MILKFKKFTKLSAEEKMKAHAWSQCGDNIITGGAGHEEFTVLSVFGWGKQ